MAVALLGATLALVVGFSGSLKLIALILAVGLLVSGAVITQNIRLYCLWALMFTIPFDLSKRMGGYILKMGGETSFRIELSDPFWLLLLGFTMHDIWRGYRPGLRIPKVCYVWMVIMAMGAAVVVFGQWRLTAAHETVRMFKVMLLFIAVTNELRRPRQLLHCAAALSASMIVQALVGLTQYVTRADFHMQMLGEPSRDTLELLASGSIQGDRVWRVGAFLTHPNIFGVFLAALLTLAIGLFLLRLSKWYKLLSFSAILLGTPALVATFSRSGWLSFACASTLLIVLMSFHPGLRRRSVIAGAAAAGAVVLVAALFAGPIFSRLFSSAPYAVEGRILWNHDAMRMIAARPILGWGLNSYVYAVPPFTLLGPRRAREWYKGWIPVVHNAYLLWMAETGAVGLLLHLIVIAIFIGYGIGNLHIRDELLFVLNAACLGAILAFMVDANFSPSLRNNAVLRLFWVVGAMIMAIRYYRIEHEASKMQHIAA
jgi:putative inorganic carbon (hco3(-)) transporter